jgi:hypothetical protein
LPLGATEAFSLGIDADVATEHVGLAFDGVSFPRLHDPPKAMRMLMDSFLALEKLMQVLSFASRLGNAHERTREIMIENLSLSSELFERECKTTTN